MRTHRRHHFSVALVALAASAVAFSSSPMSAKEPDLDAGNPFPDVALPLLAPPGEAPRIASLGDYRGEKLLLHIFASW